MPQAAAPPVGRDRLVSYRRAFSGCHGPFAFVDLSAFDRNAAALARRSSGKPIRLASKSVRVPELMKRAQSSSPIYQGVLCFSAREAVHLARNHGLDDLVIAYPALDANAIADVARLVSDGHSITLMVDSEAQLPPIEEAGKKSSVRVPVCLDLDVSQDYPGLRFGMFRSPLSDVNGVLRLAERIGRSPWLKLDGLMGYEGQVAGLGDAAGDPRTRAIRALKRRAVPLIAERRAQVVHALNRAGFALRFVNAGGTGSLESSSAEEVVTEVAMGSGLFTPTLFDAYQGFRHEPAVGFALTVTRQPARNIVTCLGGGYVASGAHGPSRLPTPFLPEGLKLLPNEGAGEVQTPLLVPPDVTLNIGDLVFFRHAKAGELCEHFNELHAVQDGQHVTSFKTYRGEGLQFP